jgi:hypothetical protein
MTASERSSPYYAFVREERQFSFVLTHLLMQRGPNLSRFLSLAGVSEVTDEQMDGTEVYVEYSRLRDDWARLGRDNKRKRERIVELLSKVDGLRSLAARPLPNEPAAFNAFFMMGRPEATIRYDIAYPGLWSVVSLSERFKGQPELFKDACKFKWSFNIKPDIVVRVPGHSPLCIEAKLESKEGTYPTARTECQKFDSFFGIEQGRVGQIDLQKFMFENLLGEPCLPVFVDRSGTPPPGVVGLTWAQVFRVMEDGLDASIPFVRKLVEENKPLHQLGEGKT